MLLIYACYSFVVFTLCDYLVQVSSSQYVPVSALTLCRPTHPTCLISHCLSIHIRLLSDQNTCTLSYLLSLSPSFLCPQRVSPCFFSSVFSTISALLISPHFHLSCNETVIHFPSRRLNTQTTHLCTLTTPLIILLETQQRKWGNNYSFASLSFSWRSRGGLQR